jgi:hypothetical protein
MIEVCRLLIVERESPPHGGLSNGFQATQSKSREAGGAETPLKAESHTLASLKLGQFSSKPIHPSTHRIATVWGTSRLQVIDFLWMVHFIHVSFLMT